MSSVSKIVRIWKRISEDDKMRIRKNFGENIKALADVRASITSDAFMAHLGIREK